MENLKLKAVAEFLNVDIEDLKESSWDENIIEYGSEEYEVLTDEEADERWEDELQNYLEECVLPELPDNLQYYFDEEKWKRDARFDGRGHCLSRYDGNEEEITIEDETFYIYRQN